MPAFDPAKAGASTWAWVLAMTARKTTIKHYRYAIRREPERRGLDDARPIGHRYRRADRVEVVLLEGLNAQETELMHLFARGFDQSGAARVMGCSRDWPRQLKLRLRAKFENPWRDSPEASKTVRGELVPGGVPA